MRTLRQRPPWALLAVLAASVLASPALASTTTGTAIDAYLTPVVTSFTQTIVGACLLIAIVVNGAELIWRLEVGHVMKGIANTCLVVGIIGGVATIIGLIGGSAAVIG